MRIDSSLLITRINSDLSSILSQNSTVFIKSYGSGSLSTPSFRGTSAHHTQVEWNGISLNSPMLGEMDLSQISVAQFDGIEILYGAAGISSSSGAFGGIINLVSSPDWSNKLNVSLSQSFASFNTYNTALNTIVGNRKIQSITKANFGTSVNDFPFQTDTGDEVRQVNSAYQNFGISEEVFAQIKNNHLFSAKIWYNYSYREIPPLTTNYREDYYENIEDESIRSIAEWKYIRSKYNLSLRSALVGQDMRYRAEGIDSRHRSDSWINRLRFSWTGTPKWMIRPGIDFNLDWVTSDAYSDKKSRKVFGLFTEFVYDPDPGLKFSLVLREDQVDGLLMPFVFALGGQYRPFKEIPLSFSANLSRNYRMPTLNDLYWDIYGNQDLQPEQSYMAEGGVVFNHLSENKKVFIESELTGYYSMIYDMILWTPSDSNSSIWKPANLKQVEARGLEAGLNMQFRIRKVEINFKSSYNFCRSTNVKALSENDQSAGKQLIYTPIHTFNATLSGGWKGYYLNLVNIYTGLRYTNTDNSRKMPGYYLANIFLGKNISLEKFVISLQAEINNLFNLDYQSIANRAMPGRNYGITVRGTFKK